MMMRLNKSITAILFLSVLTSCISQKRLNKICEACPDKVVETVTVKDSIYEVVRLDTIELPEDSSFYYAYLKCKDGKVVIVNSDKSSSGRSKLSVQIVDNKLTVKANCDAWSKVVELKDKYITRLESRKSNQVIHEKPSALVLFFAKLGLWCLVCLIVYAVYSFIKQLVTLKA